MNPKENNSKYKVSIEQRLTSLEVKVEDIIDNHLKSIAMKLDRGFWLILTVLVGVVVDLALRLM